MSKDPGSRGFMDRVFGFLGIEQESAVAKEEPPPLPPPPPRTEASAQRRGRLVSLPGARRAGEGERLSVVVQKPARFEDVQAVVDSLKERRPVILSVELVPKEVARRLVDFVSGAAYALDGRMHRLGDTLFLFTPSNVGIDVAEGSSAYPGDREDEGDAYDGRSAYDGGARYGGGRYDEEFDYPGQREV
ncbi:MAG: cell division protein SepF [Limnochordales bacterium]